MDLKYLLTYQLFPEAGGEDYHRCSQIYRCLFCVDGMFLVWAHVGLTSTFGGVANVIMSADVQIV